ncbi:MAG: hypothetical protein E7600_09280 [Ruminococcaceae bacterium]|nr:hypothetical protein [Oscillospiraceae bacterium]
MGYLLLVINTFAGLAEGIFIKKYNTKHPHGGFVFTAVISLFAAVFSALTDKGKFVVIPELVPYAIIAGLLYCIASILTYFALSIGSFAMTMLVLSYSIVFSIGYGVFFLHEPVSVFSVIGFVLLAVSLFLTRRDSVGGRFSMKWLVFILLSVVGSGMFSVVTRMQQIRFENAYDNECITIALGLSAIILFVAGLFTDVKYLKEIVKYGVPYAMGAGMVNGFRNILSLVICIYLPISVSSAMGSGLKIVISFVISYLLFKETFLKRQIVGVIIGAAALVLLNV